MSLLWPNFMHLEQRICRYTTESTFCAMLLLRQYVNASLTPTIPSVDTHKAKGTQSDIHHTNRRLWMERPKEGYKDGLGTFHMCYCFVVFPSLSVSWLVGQHMSILVTLNNVQTYFPTSVESIITFYLLQGLFSINWGKTSIMCEDKSYPCNRSWGPAVLWDIMAPTFSTQLGFCMNFLSFPWMLHTLLSNPPRLNLVKRINYEIPVMELPVASQHFLLLRSIYSPIKPVLEYLEFREDLRFWQWWVWELYPSRISCHVAW
jgi:hypothetical protein